MENLTDVDLSEFYDYNTSMFNMNDILGKRYSTNNPTLYFTDGPGTEFHNIFNKLYLSRDDYGVVKRRSYNTYLYRDITINIHDTGMLYDVKLVGKVNKIESVSLLMDQTVIITEYINSEQSHLHLFTGVFTRELPILKTANCENWYISIKLAQDDKPVIDEYPIIQIFYSSSSVIIKEPIIKTVCLKEMYTVEVFGSGSCIQLPKPFRSFGIILQIADDKFNKELCIKNVYLRNKETELLPVMTGRCLSEQVPLSLNINRDGPRKYYICFNKEMLLSTGTMKNCNDKFIEFGGQLVIDIELFSQYHGKVKSLIVETYEPALICQENGRSVMKN